jgi:uncharacterized membrane-anchored protein
MGRPSAEQFNSGLGVLRESAATARRGALYTARKVPEITLYFWIVKLLSTALGESTSDYLVYHVDPYIAVMVGGVVLAIALIVQLVVRRYIAGIYWLTVVLVAIVGTMAADVAHIVLKFEYWQSTLIFSVTLAFVFAAWYLTERTLSIHAIDSLRRELFYWATVMATFALGTAAGDLTAVTFHLGYFLSAVLFAALFALPALGYWRLGLNATAAFWTAYVVTRPLGASIADWLGKPRGATGLDLGDGPVSFALAALIFALVAYLTVTRKDMPNAVKHTLG